MDLRREIVTMTGLLVALCVILAFGAVALFARMGPAIEQIMVANVQSIIAAEEVFVTLAEAGGEPVPPAGRARIAGALKALERNITEAPEGPAVAALRARLPAALDAHGPARQAAFGELRRLIGVNRSAMRRADDDARRLGSAGAWASALLGVLAFALGLLVLRRARARLLAPIVELDEVLAGARAAQPLRRCQIRDAPDELVRVGDAVNDLLDEREARRRDAPRDLAPPLASALQGLLEERAAPTFVVDREGAVLRANERAMELLAAADGDAARERLRAAARAGASTPGLVVQPLGNQRGFLCTWTSAR